MQPSHEAEVLVARRSSSALSIAATLLAVVALAMALVVPGPQGTPGRDGTNGAPGATGATGATGPEGPQGPLGTAGTNGADGMDGVSCWDLNQNGLRDLPTEDLNGDTAVDVLDCRGPQGPSGTGAIIAYGRAPNTPSPIVGGCLRYTEVDVTITVPGPGTVIVTAMQAVRIDHTSGTPDGIDLYLADTPASCAADGWSGLAYVGQNQPTDVYYVNVPLQEAFAVTAGTYTFYINGVGFAGGATGDEFWFGSMVAVYYGG